MNKTQYFTLQAKLLRQWLIDITSNYLNMQISNFNKLRLWVCCRHQSTLWRSKPAHKKSHWTPTTWHESHQSSCYSPFFLLSSKEYTTQNYKKYSSILERNWEIPIGIPVTNTACEVGGGCSNVCTLMILCTTGGRTLCTLPQHIFVLCFTTLKVSTKIFFIVGWSEGQCNTSCDAELMSLLTVNLFYTPKILTQLH